MRRTSPRISPQRRSKFPQHDCDRHAATSSRTLPPVSTFDLIVIGSGPAGRRAAIQAAKLGKSRAGGREAAAASAASRSTPAPSRRRRCARPCSTSPAGASAASTAAPTGSRRTSRAEDLCARLHMTLDHEVEVLEHQFARNGVRHAHAARRASSTRTASRSTTDDGDDPQSSRPSAFVIAVGTRPLSARRHPVRRHAASSTATRSLEIAAPAAQPHGGRRRRHRRRIRHDLLARSTCR